MLLLVSGGYKRIEMDHDLSGGRRHAHHGGLRVHACPGTGYPPRLSDLQEGFSLGVLALPGTAVAAAFGTFGITGVGASELYAYPYWCLEKGYARYTGPRSDDPAWAERARGWLRVMYLDAWVSMVVFTVATVAFYILGATVLHRQDLHPEKSQDDRDAVADVRPGVRHMDKVFFLIGAWAVLFKTMYVASASHARLTADFSAWPTSSSTPPPIPSAAPAGFVASASSIPSSASCSTSSSAIPR